MASFPPPYPPPAPPPFSPDPRQQRRFLKDQRRAYKDMQRTVLLQAAQQRDFKRAQYRGQRRSSILGPLIVLSAGVLFLLIDLGKLPLNTFLDWYGRWWPLLLVAAGLVLVAEWAFDERGQAQGPQLEGPTVVRRSIGGGTVLLLIFLAIAGPILRAGRDHHDDFLNLLSFHPDNLDSFFGSKLVTEQQIDQAFPAGTTLAVDNPHGDVTIVGKSPDGQVHIVVSKQLYVRSDSEAQDKSQRMSPRVDLLGATLSVSLPTLPGASADLSITMPDSGAITVTTNHGTVNITGMRAAVNVTSNHGDIELNSIGGAVDAHINSSGSSFAAHNIDGPVIVKGRAQDLNVSDVRGEVSLEGEFFGDTHLERLHGPVSFHTSRTQLTLMQLDGDLDLSPHAELTGSQIVGPLRLRTTSRTISLDRVAGDIDIADTKGPVDVTSSAPLGNITIENRDGSINVTVPQQAGYDIDAETRDGSILGDLPASSTSANEHTSVHGKVGDGSARLTLQTSHADIDVHKGSIDPPVAPQPPNPPQPPATPAPAKPTSHRTATF